MLILEFNRPKNPIVRTVYGLYFMLVLPMIGNLVSGGADNAYAYLPRSVMAFPSPSSLASSMKAAGFSEVTYRPLTWGIAYVHIATK